MQVNLEWIVDTYGWEDYYDMPTGRIFQLSQATSAGDDTSEVPVIQDGRIIGFATVNRIRKEQ